MPLTAEQRELLSEYAARPDRDMEPVFVGRKGLFDLVEKNAEQIVKRCSPGHTICLHGPPGVGKTAFLEELKERCESDRLLEKGKAHYVRLLPGQLRSPSVVLAECAEQIKGFSFGLRNRKYLQSLGFQVDIPGFGGIGASADFAKGLPHDLQSTFPTALFRDGAQSMLETDHVFLFAVDEANNISPTPGQKVNELLEHLHLGTGLPIIPILVGQPHTVKNLSDTISGSRYAAGNERPMDGLDSGEGAEYAERMFNHLGVEASRADREAVAQWMEGACGGWPHHLSNAMKCLATGLLDADSMRLSDVDGRRVARRLSGRRVEYYEGRLAARTDVRHRPKTVNAALSALVAEDGGTKAVSFNEIEAAIKKGLLEDMEPASSAALMPPITVADMLLAMRRSGVIAERVRSGEQHGYKREYICPIDSLADYTLHHRHECPPFPDLEPKVSQ